MKKYILVEWPECQEFMDEDWFPEEAYFGMQTLTGGEVVLSRDYTVSNAKYFIPEHRYIEIKDKQD